MSSTSYAKEIAYDRETRDFACYLNGELVSFARTYAEGEAVLNELVTRLMANELADDTVYCEACGAPVDPAEAVLDGELMVCQGCAPCSAAEFEAMQMAEAERLMAAESEDAARFASEDAAYGAYVEEHGHDPAAWPAPETFASDPQTWVAVSEVPCAPVITIETAAVLTPAQQDEYARITGEFYARAEAGAPVAELTALHEAAEAIRWGRTPAPAGAVSSISRVELFDALCSSVDELRDYWRDVPRRLKAINEAWEVVLLAEAFYFNANGDLLVESGSKPGAYYAVGHTCPCQAGRWGNHCRHSTVADLIGRAVRIARMQKVA